MRSTSYLPKFVIAFALMLAATLGADAYMRSVEGQYLHALARIEFDAKNLGSGLERQALAQPDLLVLYGSSEVALTGLYDSYPTGFDVFRLGGAGTGSLIYVESAAAAGKSLRGRKVVISTAPGSFYFQHARPDYYAGNFSRLHAYETAFSLDLSQELKHDIARRMLDFPDTVDTDPLLQFALERLADGSPLSLAQYYLAFPLGRFQIWVYGLQDDWEAFLFIRQHPNLRAEVPHILKPINWDSLLQAARTPTEQESSNNPFGFENTYWKGNGGDLLKLVGTETDTSFRNRLAKAEEWGDLELLLREMKELGAQPLILSTPLPGPYYGYLGISPSGRSSYYQALESLAARYGDEVVDYAGHDGDKYFVGDRWSHPSALGAIYYQRALDDFFHGQTTAMSRLNAESEPPR